VTVAHTAAGCAEDLPARRHGDDVPLPGRIVGTGRDLAPDALHVVVVRGLPLDDVRGEEAPRGEDEARAAHPCDRDLVPGSGWTDVEGEVLASGHGRRDYGAPAHGRRGASLTTRGCRAGCRSVGRRHRRGRVSR
jgi:hypothetical protein